MEYLLEDTFLGEHLHHDIGDEMVDTHSLDALGSNPVVQTRRYSARRTLGPCSICLQAAYAP